MRLTRLVFTSARRFSLRRMRLRACGVLAMSRPRMGPTRGLDRLSELNRIWRAGARREGRALARPASRIVKHVASIRWTERLTVWHFAHQKVLRPPWTNRCDRCRHTLQADHPHARKPARRTREVAQLARGLRVVANGRASRRDRFGQHLAHSPAPGASIAAQRDLSRRLPCPGGCEPGAAPRIHICCRGPATMPLVEQELLHRREAAGERAWRKWVEVRPGPDRLGPHRGLNGGEGIQHRPYRPDRPSRSAAHR